MRSLVLGKRADGVPLARRFAREALDDLVGDALADAELVVSELVTNASLHGEPPISVRLLRFDRTTRIEVEDAGSALPVRVQRDFDATTGRGLTMVASLADRWGVERGATGGKIVWAEIDGTCLAEDPLAGTESAQVGAAPAQGCGPRLPSPPDTPKGHGVKTYKVKLSGVSTELLLAAKTHIDGVIRELTLLRDGVLGERGNLPKEMAALVESATVDFVDARTEMKRQGAIAAEKGEPLTDLELDLPLSAAVGGERYLAALEEADRYARTSQLLTLAPPRSHALFRAWYVRSIIDQLRAHSRGESSSVPTDFPVQLAAEVDRLSHLENESARLAMLQIVHSELTGATSPEEMAKIVVDNAAHFLRVDSARVYLVTDHGTLRSAAWRMSKIPGRDRFEEFPIEAELPGAIVFRTRQPFYAKSMADISERFRGLEGRRPSEISFCNLPLTVGEHCLGVLSVTSRNRDLSDEAQTAALKTLADALAQALHRAELAASDEEARGTLAFLAEATEILVSAREPTAVVESLVGHAVPRLGDWCTVYMERRGQLVRMAMAIDGFADVAARLAATPPISVDLDLPQTRAYRTGVAQPVPEGVGRLLTQIYPDVDFEAMGGDPDRGSGLCVPIILRGSCIGVIAIAFLASGRRLTEHALAAASGLASRAAIALDNAQRWSEQQKVVQTLVSALLPSQPPTVPGMQFAARYLPAGGDVAGDWWETTLMPDGRILVGLGDAAGHGIDAVSQMLELRHGARALAAVEQSPAALLSDLNRRLAGPDASFATAVYGRLDPASGRLKWASAGHVPLLHFHADGTVTILRDRDTTPLGVPRARPRRDQLVALEPGDTLVLFSDGVVERRDQDLDRGIGKLTDTVSQHLHENLESLADAIILRHGDHPVDDCCLLLVRRDP